MTCVLIVVHFVTITIISCRGSCCARPDALRPGAFTNLLHSSSLLFIQNANFHMAWQHRSVYVRSRQLPFSNLDLDVTYVPEKANDLLP